MAATTGACASSEATALLLLASNNESKQNTNPTPEFLKMIPPEIRNQIYKLVSAGGNNANNLRFLLTCRQINFEASGIAWWSTTFEFNRKCPPRTLPLADLRSQLNSLPQERRDNITSLVFPDSTGHVRIAYALSDNLSHLSQRERKSIGEILACPNLQRLECDIPFGWTDHRGPSIVTRFWDMVCDCGVERMVFKGQYHSLLRLCHSLKGSGRCGDIVAELEHLESKEVNRLSRLSPGKLVVVRKSKYKLARLNGDNGS